MRLNFQAQTETETNSENKVGTGMAKMESSKQDLPPKLNDKSVVGMLGKATELSAALKSKPSIRASVRHSVDTRKV